MVSKTKHHKTRNRTDQSQRSHSHKHAYRDTPTIQSNDWSVELCSDQHGRTIRTLYAKHSRCSRFAGSYSMAVSKYYNLRSRESFTALHTIGLVRFLGSTQSESWGVVERQISAESMVSIHYANISTRWHHTYWIQHAPAIDSWTRNGASHRTVTICTCLFQQRHLWIRVGWEFCSKWHRINGSFWITLWRPCFDFT